MVEIIPKPTPKPPFWSNILLYFSLGLLLLTILTYFICDSFLKKLETNQANLEKALIQVRTAEKIALEREVFDYQKKIGDFAQLVKRQKNTSKFFDLLQKICHPKVWFSRLSLSLEDFQVEISGETETFQILGQQLLILKKEPLIKNLNLSKIAIGEKGKVNFTLNFTLDPEIFK